MSSSGGIFRFGFFVAVIVLGATGYYAYSQSQKVAAYRSANAALIGERDSLLMKNDELSGNAAKADIHIQELEAKVAELEDHTSKSR